jgi:D-glycero-alpha-D-manno-heptose-7-phosphate kinase
MMFYCPANTRYKVQQALQSFGGDFRPYQFTERGLFTWNI